VAFRGFSAVTPENTLTAFRRAGQAGCHRLSSELRLSRDGRVFCFADPSLHRITGSHGWFHRLSAFEIRLRSLPFGGNAFRVERIPPLEDLLDFARDENLALQLSIPVGTSPRWRGIIDSSAEAVLDILAPWQGKLDLQLCTSDRRMLKSLLARSPWPVGGNPERYGEGLAFLEEPGLAFLVVSRDLFIPARRRKRDSFLAGGMDLLDACRKRGLRFYIGPVRKRPELDRLRALDLDGILSPHTAQLAALGIRRNT
jgi:glycerophosphoryl diester phosphodiesterase